MAISPQIRQFFVIGACQLVSVSAGCAMGFPVVLLLQLREDSSSIKLNIDTASWIGSIHGFAGILSIFISILMQWKGRKAAFMVGCVIIIAGWILAYTATSVTAILVSEFFHGCAINGLSTVSYLTMSETTPPKYRNVSVQCYPITTTLGISIAGIMSKFIHWRTFCLIFCVPSVISLLLSCLWPESPPWLAYQGKFRECEGAFKQLRLMREPSKKELYELIAAQKENLLSEKHPNKHTLHLFWSTLKRRDFYMPAIHTFVLLSLTYCSGSGVFIIASYDIMKQVTSNNRAIFVGGIVSSVLFFVNTCVSILLSKRFNNKSVILCTAASAVACLIGIIVVNLLQSFHIMTKESIIGLVFVIAFAAVVAFGMLTVVFTVTSEIMPVKHRGVGGAMYIIFNSILHSTTLKISPYLFLYINLWGTLLLFTLNAVICGIFIWKFVPETRNRTLQEIEDFYTHGRFIESRFKGNDSSDLIESSNSYENMCFKNAKLSATKEII